MVVGISLCLLSPNAIAKKGEGGAPPGWSKGEKKGWQGADMPPGLAKKDAEKAQRQADKEARKAEKEAKKKAKQAEKEARKKSKEAEKKAD